uniref:Calponin-homology (CH) domain-containing protein n=1 Tax=Pygocentrus nattereri TaxID=42514 RepID=A0A3B4C9Z9_PYGNA
MSHNVARAGLLDFSPTFHAPSHRSGDKANKENEASVPVLSLVQFSRSPFVAFGTIKLGSSKSLLLRIENPCEDAVTTVTVDKISSSKGFSVDQTSFTIQVSIVIITITWTPVEEGGVRELLSFVANGIVKHQAILLGKAEATKKKKVSIPLIMNFIVFSHHQPQESPQKYPQKSHAQSQCNRVILDFILSHLLLWSFYNYNVVLDFYKNVCLVFTGGQSLKSFSTSSVKTSKVIAVAQARLNFIKPAQTAIPRHPMPFAAKNMFYDERWLEKQERGFTWWMNYVLTPDDFKVTTEVAKGVLSFNIPKAPTKEEMSFKTYTARRRLNRLRRAACQLFTSDSMVKAIQRLELEVEAKRLLVRKDRHLWKDIGERQKLLNWLLSYNPLWLRIGLETIFGELIPLESNSDVMGLAMFVLGRLLWNPDIATEFRHPKVPHLYRDGHDEALSRFTLKKLLLLVCFLDKAKESRLIEHDPCLFCMDAEFKQTKDLLLAFARDFLSGEGILSRHLNLLGLPVSHVQTPLAEFSFAVQNLAVDLRCGIRLVRIMELFTQDWSLSSKLRMPAISRLQKVHNVDIALQVLKEKGVSLKDEHGTVIDSRDIVDGHREKTLNLLWKIIFTFQVEVLLDEVQLKDEISFLKKTWRTKQKLALLKADKCAVMSSKGSPRFEQPTEKLTLLMDWVNAVCDFYNLKAENLTVSFSDGRVLCYLIHHYHPNYLVAESIHQKTTQTIECDLRGKVELNNSSSDSDCSFDSLEQLLENEKSNFQLVNKAVSYLGGVPAMISPEDMSNTIPNEKVVTCYLSFLCARLLDLRNETRAARVIQSAWRRYKLQKDIQLNQQRNLAACKIQALVRSFIQKRRVKRHNRAATTIQAFWRGFSAQKDKRYYQKLLWEKKRAAVVLQAAFRGMKARQALKLKHQAAIVLQSAYRAHCAQTRYLCMKYAAIAIQQRYRSMLAARKQRQDFLKLRYAAISLQAHFRGQKVRREIIQKHQAAMLIQASFRKHREVTKYQAMRLSAIILQRHYRSFVEAKVDREKYLMVRKSVILIQAAFRGYTVRRTVEAARAVRRQRFIAAAYHHLCAVRIQRALRAHWALKAAKKQISSVVYIQRWFRAKLHRKRYLEQRQKIIMVQRAVKVWLGYRNQAATVIQRAAKCFLLRRRKERQRQGVIKLLALWRGHCSRKLHDTKKIISIRHRLRKVNREAKEEDKLCNKTATALSYLLGYQNYAYILAALKHLETATRLSPECCEHLVESGATHTIFTLIRSCNRSVPSMEIITLATQVLLNLSKYNKTIEAVYEVPDSVDTLLDLLQIYREKAGDKVADKGGSIFTKACFLLVILVQDQERAMGVKKLPKASERISSIYRLTLRKYKMDAQRTQIKQRMNVSLNGSFLPPPTPQKSKPVARYVLVGLWHFLFVCFPQSVSNLACIQLVLLEAVLTSVSVRIEL